jgi:hypothetical protein
MNHISSRRTWMSRKTRANADATWVTVPVDNELHGEVRAQAVRQHKDWTVVVAEAMKLWLSAQSVKAA